MAVTLISNADILTLDNKSRIFTDADIVITDGVISHIDQIPEDLVPDERIDGSGCLVMPGLYNSHSHAPMALLRGIAEDLFFKDWLPRIWRVENQLTPDDIYWGTQLAMAEMIRSGTVGFNDMYFHMDRVAQAVAESGMKARLGWTVFTPGEGTEIGAALHQTLDWIEEIDQMSNSRIKTYLAPHAPYTCSTELLEKTVALAHDRGLGIHLHLSESEEQVAQSLKDHGLRPVQYVDQLGVFDVQGGAVAAHCLHLNEKDISILAQKKVRVPHCPITYMKLAMPFFSLKPSLEAGVQVCLGTDGPASNSDMDMFAVMRQTGLTQKMLTADPTFLAGDQILRLATAAGASALGFPESGSLEIGRPADLILIRTDVPHHHPRHNITANAIYNTKGSDVTDVMIDGRWVMRRGELLTLDLERILLEVGKRKELSSR